MKRAIIAALALLVPATAFAGSERQDDPPDINFQFKVDQAIKKGLAYLQGKHIAGHKGSGGDELILLTYLHAGKDPNDPHFKAIFEKMLEEKLEHTYKVVLQAMCLEEFERVKYQYRIHQCAQFLVDNISPTGRTRYGTPSIYVEEVKTPTPGRQAVSTISKRGVKKPKEGDPYHNRGPKPTPQNIIQVKQKRPGPEEHDHSNMQYAALGLRACYDSGIRFEPELIALVDKWWREKQEKDDPNVRRVPLMLSPPKADKKKSSRSSRRGPGSTRTMTAVMAKPRGWSYTGPTGPWGSMTAGAIGALCILDYIQGKDWRTDQNVLDGLAWEAKNFSVTKNPRRKEEKGDENHYYYYMYGLERAGMLFGTEAIGEHKWYREGAEQLLKDQGKDGSWSGAVNTCFAILFLRRATAALPVASQGSRRR